MYYTLWRQSPGRFSNMPFRLLQPTGKITPVSLMTLIIAASGERKTSAESAIVKGIREFDSRKAKKRGGAK